MCTCVCGAYAYSHFRTKSTTKVYKAFLKPILEMYANHSCFNIYVRKYLWEIAVVYEVFFIFSSFSSYFFKGIQSITWYLFYHTPMQCYVWLITYDFPLTHGINQCAGCIGIDKIHSNIKQL